MTRWRQRARAVVLMRLPSSPRLQSTCHAGPAASPGRSWTASPPAGVPKRGCASQRVNGKRLHARTCAIGRTLATGCGPMAPTARAGRRNTARAAGSTSPTLFATRCTRGAGKHAFCVKSRLSALLLPHRQLPRRGEHPQYRPMRDAHITLSLPPAPTAERAAQLQKHLAALLLRCLLLVLQLV